MSIRDSERSDLESLAELLLSVHQLHVDAHPEIYRGITHSDALGLITSRFSEPSTYLRVAEYESEIHGYYSAEVRSTPEHPLLQPGRFIYLNEIVVAPMRRRRGVGRALIVDLREIARQERVGQIKLDVGHFNSDAKAFFASEGFDVLRESRTASVAR